MPRMYQRDRLADLRRRIEALSVTVAALQRQPERRRVPSPIFGSGGNDVKHGLPYVFDVSTAKEVADCYDLPPPLFDSCEESEDLTTDALFVNMGSLESQPIHLGLSPMFAIYENPDESGLNPVFDMYPDDEDKNCLPLFSDVYVEEAIMSDFLPVFDGYDDEGKDFFLDLPVFDTYEEEEYLQTESFPVDNGLRESPIDVPPVFDDFDDGDSYLGLPVFDVYNDEYFSSVSKSTFELYVDYRDDEDDINFYQQSVCDVYKEDEVVVLIKLLPLFDELSANKVERNLGLVQGAHEVFDKSPQRDSLFLTTALASNIGLLCDAWVGDVRVNVKTCLGFSSMHKEKYISVDKIVGGSPQYCLSDALIVNMEYLFPYDSGGIHSVEDGFYLHPKPSFSFSADPVMLMCGEPEFKHLFLFSIGKLRVFSSLLTSANCMVAIENRTVTYLVDLGVNHFRMNKVISLLASFETNTAMVVIVNAKLVGYAWKVLGEMLKKDLRPTVVTFGTSIHWVCSKMRIYGAYTRMEVRVYVVNGICYEANIEIPLNTTGFNVPMSSHYKNRDFAATIYCGSRWAWLIYKSFAFDVRVSMNPIPKEGMKRLATHDTRYDMCFGNFAWLFAWTTCVNFVFTMNRNLLISICEWLIAWRKKMGMIIEGYCENKTLACKDYKIDYGC